jgi:hypothetical protein
VQEIDRLQPITKVPRRSLSSRGHPCAGDHPGVDLARRLTSGDRRHRDPIIIASLRGQASASSSVSGSSRSPPRRSARPAADLRPRAAVHWMARVGETLISLLSIDQLLSTEEIGQLQQQQPLF